jgi:polysaccharide biosynthesis transport protein
LQSLQGTIEAQQAQLAKLRGTYGPEHPKIRELEAQIATTRQSLADEHRALATNNQTELAHTRQLEQKYIAAIAEQKAKVGNLRESQDEGSKLVLELESARAVYKQALDGFDQIMFQAVANHANVSIVSRAVPPLRASKPNKMKLLLGVLVAGLGLGVAGPLAYELFFDRRLRCRDDMEREFGIAVLAQLDAVPALARAT